MIKNTVFQNGSKAKIQIEVALEVSITRMVCFHIQYFVCIGLSSIYNIKILPFSLYLAQIMAVENLSCGLFNHHLPKKRQKDI
jgi:hypothetical protein